MFVLPSREEGLAMVQAQAVACNLPLIGNFDSGAEDLQRLVEYPQYITLIKEYTVSAVADALRSALEKQKTLNVCYAGNVQEILFGESVWKTVCKTDK